MNYNEVYEVMEKTGIALRNELMESHIEMMHAIEEMGFKGEELIGLSRVFNSQIVDAANFNLNTVKEYVEIVEAIKSLAPECDCDKCEKEEVLEFTEEQVAKIKKLMELGLI